MEKLIRIIAVSSIVLSVLIVFAGCKKDSQGYDVTITCYSTHPKFLLKYNHEGGYKVDTIYQSNYTMAVKVKKSDLYYAYLMYNLDYSLPDSMHIQAEYDGKKVEMGIRSLLASPYSVDVELSEAK